MIDYFESTLNSILGNIRVLACSNSKDIQKRVWLEERIHNKSLQPIVLMGILDHGVIDNDPELIFLRDRPMEYCYFKLPLSLLEVILRCDQLSPLYDDLTRMDQINRYGSIKGMLYCYEHDLKNALDSNNISRVNEILPAIKEYFNRKGRSISVPCGDAVSREDLIALLRLIQKELICEK